MTPDEFCARWPCIKLRVLTVNVSDDESGAVVETTYRLEYAIEEVRNLAPRVCTQGVRVSAAGALSALDAILMRVVSQTVAGIAKGEEL